MPRSGSSYTALPLRPASFLSSRLAPGEGQPGSIYPHPVGYSAGCMGIAVRLGLLAAIAQLPACIPIPISPHTVEGRYVAEEAHEQIALGTPRAAIEARIGPPSHFLGGGKDRGLRLAPGDRVVRFDRRQSGVRTLPLPAF